MQKYEFEDIQIQSNPDISVEKLDNMPSTIIKTKNHRTFAPGDDI